MVGGVNNLMRRLRGPDQRDGRVRRPDLARATSAEDHRRYKATSTRSRTTSTPASTSMNALLQETETLIQADPGGKLRRGETRAASPAAGASWWRRQRTCDAFVGPMNVSAEYVDRISKGDIPPRITDSYNGDFNEIKNNLNTCIDAHLRTDDGDQPHVPRTRRATSTSRQQQEVPRWLPRDGRGAEQDGLRTHRGQEEGHGRPSSVVGNFEGPSEKFPGKKAFINETMEQVRACLDVIKALIQDAEMLSQAAVEGKLQTRADASKHEGDFRKIVQGSTTPWTRLSVP